MYFTGKELDFAIELSLHEYASVAGPTPASSSASSAIPTPSSTTKPEELVSGFAKLSVTTDIPRTVLNVEKAAKYKAASAKVMFLVDRCIGELDQELVEPYTNAKDRWQALWRKYSVLTPETKREDLKQITGFEFGKNREGKDVDMTIDSAWTTLISVRGKVVAANPALSATFDEEMLFEYLVAGLPPSFDVVCQSLDGSLSMSVHEKLRALEKVERKYGLSVKGESANFARQGAR
jgi:hypothetical protein